MLSWQCVETQGQLYRNFPFLPILDDPRYSS